MLKTNQKNPGDIITFRVSTGEEILGELVSLDAQTLEVKRPRTIVQTGQGVGLGPATMLGDPEGTVEYSANHVVSYMKTRNELETAYREQTSGIQIATSDKVSPINPTTR